MRRKYALVIDGTLAWKINKDGKIIKRGKQKMHSFTNNFARYITSLLKMPIATIENVRGTYEASYHEQLLPNSVRDTFGNYRSLVVGTALGTSSPFELSLLGIKAPAGNDYYGIVIGSGTTPATPNDYDLVDQYWDGAEPGCFLYHDTVFEGPTPSDNKIILKVSRSFTNQAGINQTIGEIGILAWHHWQISNYHASYNSSDVQFLIARDVLTSPATVPNGATFTVTYIFQFY